VTRHRKRLVPFPRGPRRSRFAAPGGVARRQDHPVGIHLQRGDLEGGQVAVVVLQRHGSLVSFDGDVKISPGSADGRINSKTNVLPNADLSKG
jgi:hypothetical protein